MLEIVPILKMLGPPISGSPGLSLFNLMVNPRLPSGVKEIHLLQNQTNFAQAKDKLRTVLAKANAFVLSYPI